MSASVSSIETEWNMTEITQQVIENLPDYQPTNFAEIIRSIVEGTAHLTGVQFFQSLVANLARAIDVQYAFIAEFTETRLRVRTRAFWAKDHIAADIEYDLAGTPCEDVVAGKLCYHERDIQRKFPLDTALVDLSIESYLGIPLTDAEGNVFGHLAVLDERPMPDEPWRSYVIKWFAIRAAAELQRLQSSLALEASERRFRDLFDEAPIAYVFEDTETRFVKVNQAAMQLLGLKPEEVTQTVGMSLVAPDQSTQQRIQEAFADIQQGKPRSLPELELRRKDNGQPVWVQFWSRPEPDGKLTRTMIIDITERVLAQREQARLMRQTAYLQEEIKQSHNFEEIIGRSKALASVLEHVRAVAPTDASVLIHGETGTGKELIARAIHSLSKRRDRPLIKVNCAALPAGLVESELFGHEKGAFTGAIAKRIGRFELADGGTIFLDEIGEVPLEMQAKLLRALQEHEIDRIGGRAPIKIDVRIIAATNRDLAQAVRDKEFREDLFYRLNVFPIQLPPLRMRKDDVPLLANYFLARFAGQMGKRFQGIHSETMDRLVAYAWPGNIRELENVMERSVILCSEEWLIIDPHVLLGTFKATSNPIPSDGLLVGSQSKPREISATDGASNADYLVSGSLESIEKAHILSVLGQTNWRIEGEGGAAQILGLHPNTLRSRIKKLGLCRPTN
jgi:PAS domain S-box-containing protein